MSFAFKSLYFDTPIENGRVLDLFSPEKITRKTALFFVHGGGWRAGSRMAFHKIMRAFNADGYVAASTDYRLAGVNLAAQLTDVRHGYDLFLKELRGMKLPEHVAVYGGSAGALLAALLSMTEPGECGEETFYKGVSLPREWTPPVAVLLSAFTPFFTPWKDIFPGIWESMEHIAGAPYDKDPARYERFSPIRYVRASTPPMFVSHAENEHMFPLANLRLFEKALRSHSRPIEIKTYTGAEHGFFYDVTRRQQIEMFDDMKTFLSRFE